MKSELERMTRVSDLMVTGHSLLCDRYRRYGTIVDVALISLSAVALTFSLAPDELISDFNPTNLRPNTFIAICALAIFVLSLVQLKVDWKGKSGRHSEAVRTWMKAKRAVNNALSSPNLNQSEFNLAQNEFDNAGDFSISIPESEFLKCKSHHLRKIEISKHLSKYPHASPALTKMKLWAKDNFSYK